MGNSDNVKKIALAAVIVIAVVVAFMQGKTAVQGEQMVIEGGFKMPAGFKSEKEHAVEAQKASTSGSPPPFDDTKKIADLGG